MSSVTASYNTNGNRSNHENGLRVPPKCVRDRLRVSIEDTADRMTKSEHSFLNWLLKDGKNEADLEFASKLLSDSRVFPKPFEGEMIEEGSEGSSRLCTPKSSPLRFNKGQGVYQNGTTQASSLSIPLMSEVGGQDVPLTPKVLEGGDIIESELLRSSLENDSTERKEETRESYPRSSPRLPPSPRGRTLGRFQSFGVRKRDILPRRDVLDRSTSLPPMYLADSVKRERHLRRRRSSIRLSRVGLWKAYQDGVAPSELKRVYKSLASDELNDELKNEAANSSTRNIQKKHRRKMSTSDPTLLFSNDMIPEDYNDPLDVSFHDPFAALIEDQQEHPSTPLQSSSKLHDKGESHSTPQQVVTDRSEPASPLLKSVKNREASTGNQGIELVMSLDVLQEDLTTNDDDDDATDSSFESDAAEAIFDAWNVLKDEYAIGYGANDSLPFDILGTSADDVEAHPHVLSPPLMDSLSAFLPNSVASNNFWLKYSLIRDGASLYTLMQNIRGATCTIISVETIDGRVFGGFATYPWRKDFNYFGNGESFLWRMRQSRLTPCASILDQAVMESELDVFPATSNNEYYQLCLDNMIAFGGGKFHEHEEEGSEEKAQGYVDNGFGFAINKDLISGTTSPCSTYNNCCLCSGNTEGFAETFKIANLEVWTFTPCHTVEDAEKLELGKLFLRSHSKSK